MSYQERHDRFIDAYVAARMPAESENIDADVDRLLDMAAEAWSHYAAARKLYRFEPTRPCMVDGCEVVAGYTSRFCPAHAELMSSETT